MGYAILTATLLLLIHYGREGAAVIANSNSSSTRNVQTGNDISLNISYTTLSSNPTVSWTINGVVQAIWTNNSQPQVSPSYAGRLSFLENGSLLLANSTKKDTGSYTATITVVGESPATLTFQVKIYDPVVNVKVTQSSQVVSGNTAVNLSCKASGDVELVSWTKNGQIVGNSDPYSLLDGNYTLQIKNPDSTYSGNYTCNASNPVSWSNASWGLTIPYPVGIVTVKQSPQVVSENTSAVNLSCSASSGYNETVTWMKDGQSITNNSNYNLLDGNQTLHITQPNRTFSGNYSCTISNAMYRNLGSLQLRVYDPVVNVAVSQSPQKVNEGAALVNLSCSASSGYTEMVTWMKDGQSVISKNPYSLLDGNQTLQITQPDRTFNGLYTCNISNAAYWGSGSLGLTISYATLCATSTYSMVIITLLGGILLAH